MMKMSVKRPDLKKLAARFSKKKNDGQETNVIFRIKCKIDQPRTYNSLDPLIWAESP